ncbi:siphovirus ReqiPepy6 Gp37-like family protein [Streptomyces sp. NPDC050095]|uniref:siphovirus ReqiPepy6 Gp37-like family protein n=1 Tax=unclassified Streptomyces TaxID=2593676 RepID=UPI0034436971
MGEIDEWISLDFTVRLCQAGSWQIVIKDGTVQSQLVEKGGGVVIWQEGVSKPILSGQVETIQKYWTKVQHTGRGSLFIGGKCHNALAYRRLAFPDPSRPVSGQWQAPATRLIKSTTSVATTVYNELNKSLGPGSLADRRIAGLKLTAPSFSADGVADSVRMDVVGTKLEEWLDDYRAAYRFIYNPGTQQIDLNIFRPRDLSKDVRFATELGNLREFIWTLSAPSATRAIVGCGGEGASRYFYQKIDADSESEWGMQKEVFVDRSDIPLKTDKSGNPALVVTTQEDGLEDIGLNPDGNEWTQKLSDAKAALQAAKDRGQENYDVEYDAVKYATDEAKPVAISYYLGMVKDAAKTALQEGEKNGNFQIYPLDTPDCAFGRDYFVGDKVTVAVDGTEYSDIVREVVVSVDDGGKTQDVSPKIGEQGTGDPLNLYRTVYEMQKQLRKMQSKM